MIDTNVKRKKNIFASLFSVAGILIIGKVLAFFKQVLAAGYFGATIETDLISLSEGFIANVDYVIINTLSTAIVTQFIHLRTKDQEEADALTTNVVLFVFIFISAVVGILMALSPLISRVLAPSFSAENSATLTQYLLILLPCIVFISLSSIFGGVLQAQKRFIPSQLASLILSVASILAIVLFGEKYGAVVQIPAFIVYVVINFVLLFCVSKREWKFSFKYLNPFSNSAFIESLKIMAPLFLAYSAIFINQQVDKIIVSGLSEGAVSSLGYASTLSNFVIAIISAMTGVIYSHVTNDVAAGNEERAMTTVAKAINVFVAVLIPVSIVSMLCSNDIVAIAFFRGKFDIKAVELTSLALSGYAVSFVFYSIKSVFNKVLYSYKDTKWPMLSSVIAICFNIALSIVLSRSFGIFGVAIASSFAEIIACIIDYCVIRAKRIKISCSHIWLTAIRWCLASAITVAICLLFNRFSLNHLLRFVLVTLSSFVLCSLLYLREIVIRIKSKLNKNSKKGV